MYVKTQTHACHVIGQAKLHSHGIECIIISIRVRSCISILHQLVQAGSMYGRASKSDSLANIRSYPTEPGVYAATNSCQILLWCPIILVWANEEPESMELHWLPETGRTKEFTLCLCGLLSLRVHKIWDFKGRWYKPRETETRQLFVF